MPGFALGGSGGSGAEKVKRQSVYFDSPLSDSGRGKCTVDGFNFAVVQMRAASVHTSGAVTRDTCLSTGGGLRRRRFHVVLAVVAAVAAVVVAAVAVVVVAVAVVVAAVAVVVVRRRRRTTSSSSPRRPQTPGH